MNDDEYRKKLELEILGIIESSLKSNQIDATRAQQIAKLVLDNLHPHMNLEQIHQVALQLDDYFPELSPIALEVENAYQDKIVQLVKDKATKLIAEGHVQEASDMLKQALNKQIKLGS